MPVGGVGVGVGPPVGGAGGAAGTEARARPAEGTLTAASLIDAIITHQISQSSDQRFPVSIQYKYYGRKKGRSRFNTQISKPLALLGRLNTELTILTGIYKQLADSQNFDIWTNLFQTLYCSYLKKTTLN